MVVCTSSCLSLSLSPCSVCLVLPKTRNILWPTNQQRNSTRIRGKSLVVTAPNRSSHLLHRRGSIAVVRDLIDQRIRVDKTRERGGNTPLRCSCFRGTRGSQNRGTTAITFGRAWKGPSVCVNPFFMFSWY